MFHIGLITFYWKNDNYGGLLQAYATTRFFNNLKGCQAQQIATIPPHIETKMRGKVPEHAVERRTPKKILGAAWRGVKAHYTTLRAHSLQADFAKRATCYTAFEEAIPHVSDYCALTPDDAALNAQFDAFVAGSDQIWNPNWYSARYYLSFADAEKLTVSYAPSMGVSTMTQAQSERVIPLIQAVKHVSVREKTGQTLIQNYAEKDVSVVVDPVLLLDATQWDAVAVSPLADQQYAYAYLLGDRACNRTMAQKVARAAGVPLATVPYAEMKYNRYSASFGDIQRNEVGPAEFLGLIRDSEMVLTDSFHATAFAIIFKKQFFAFARNAEHSSRSMNSRITDLLAVLGLSDRFIADESQLTDAMLAQKIDYTEVHRALAVRKVASIDFLQTAFAGTEIEAEIAKQKEHVVREAK